MSLTVVGGDISGVVRRGEPEKESGGVHRFTAAGAQAERDEHGRAADRGRHQADVDRDAQVGPTTSGDGFSDETT